MRFGYIREVLHVPVRAFEFKYRVYRLDHADHASGSGPVKKYGISI